MKTLLVTLTASTLLAAAFVTPAFATTGDEAVKLCNQTKDCIVDIGKGGDVLILGPKGGTVTCPSLSAQCTAHPGRIKTAGAHLQTAHPTPTQIILQ